MISKKSRHRPYMPEHILNEIINKKLTFPYYAVLSKICINLLFRNVINLFQMKLKMKVNIFISNEIENEIQFSNEIEN